MLDLAPLLVSAVILGLLGGGHCLGMCGGLMGALTLAIPKEQRSRRFRLLLAYNLGRILSYATAGLLIGLAGWAVANSPAAMFMRVIAGLLLIAMGLYLAGWWSGLTRIESLGRGLAAYPAGCQQTAAGVEPAPGIAAGRAVGLAAVRSGLQHAVVGGEPGQRAGQCIADARVRARHLARTARHGAGSRTGNGTVT